MTIEQFGGALAKKGMPGQQRHAFYLSSGLDLERWMVKVYCGLVAAKKIRGQAGKITERSDLEPHLLPALFGTKPLPPPLGLYVQSFVGQKLVQGTLIPFGTIKLFDGSDEVGGLVLTLGVINFVLITSLKFGRDFKESKWYRHQTRAFNIRDGRTRLGYLFTF